MAERDPEREWRSRRIVQLRTFLDNKGVDCSSLGVLAGDSPRRKAACLVALQLLANDHRGGLEQFERGRLPV
jgi:hypothetical protein